MWLEKLNIANIKCFDTLSLNFTSKTSYPYKWITFLGENGSGKTSVLRSLALLLAGPEGAEKLLTPPLDWVRDETQPGVLSAQIRQGAGDPGRYRDGTKTFRYSYYVTGARRVKVKNKILIEESITSVNRPALKWLRENAFGPRGTGWFAAGYGAFRRLTQSKNSFTPSMEPQPRYTNFLSLFNEGDPLAVFEHWMVYLDYRMAKTKDREATKQMDCAVSALNKLLPDGTTFDKVTEDARVFFRVGGQSVPTSALSEGYRSILAFGGDLLWRLITTYPESQDPLIEQGVVLIDELDIHLHPRWQREIAGWLRDQFPNVQFFIATHSPYIAADAGEDALTLRFISENGKSSAKPIEDIYAMDVERALTGDAFNVESPYSPDTQSKIDRYDSLLRKTEANRTEQEDFEFQVLRKFMGEVRPIGGPPEPGSLEYRIEQFLEKHLP